MSKYPQSPHDINRLQPLTIPTSLRAMTKNISLIFLLIIAFGCKNNNQFTGQWKFPLAEDNEHAESLIIDLNNDYTWGWYSTLEKDNRHTQKGRWSIENDYLKLHVSYSESCKIREGDAFIFHTLKDNGNTLECEIDGRIVKLKKVKQ